MLHQIICFCLSLSQAPPLGGGTRGFTLEFLLYGEPHLKLKSHICHLHRGKGMISFEYFLLLCSLLSHSGLVSPQHPSLARVVSENHTQLNSVLQSDLTCCSKSLVLQMLGSAVRVCLGQGGTSWSSALAPPWQQGTYWRVVCSIPETFSSLLDWWHDLAHKKKALVSPQAG